MNFSTCRTLFLIICQAERKIYYAEYAKMAKGFSRCRATKQLFYGTEFTGSYALWLYIAMQKKPPTLSLLQSCIASQQVEKPAGMFNLVFFRPPNHLLVQYMSRHFCKPDGQWFNMHFCYHCFVTLLWGKIKKILLKGGLVSLSLDIMQVIYLCLLLYKVYF